MASREEIATRRTDARLFLLPGLPSGRVVLSAVVQPNAHEGSVDVVAGETVELTLE